jgi:uncharacterized repeat protein (TIGR01451 family)
MVASSLGMIASPKADAISNAGLPSSGEYFRVLFSSESDRAALESIPGIVVRSEDWGAYVRASETLKSQLSRKVELAGMPDRTRIDMLEQGVGFDTAIGYDIPLEWRNTGTSLRIVQFVVTPSAEWLAGLEKVAGPVLRSIGDNAFVVRMDSRQEVQAKALECVEWVGAYEPRFKVFGNLLGMTGDVHLTVSAFPGVETSRLMAELSALGAWGIEDTQYGSILCWIDASMLPTVARLESVSLVEHLPEMKTLASASGRVVQAHDLWVNTVSNLPQNVMGQGQIVHVQDSGLDSSHRDFINGPLGNRIIYSDTAIDTDGHGTFMTGIIAGSGYDMETYLGLPTTNRIYNELAATNPAGMPDRMGFAGRAPEATIYFRNGLISTEWAAGYTAGARIFSNAWGPAGMINTYDSTADTFMNANAGALVLFAAGSDGPKSNTVSGAGTGKLALSVGAFENIRPVQGENSDDPNQVRQSSSRGPVADGRVKPDILEVGGNVYGPKSDDVDDFAQPGLYNTLSLINTDPDASQYDYIMLSGTSVAVSAASGDSVLIRDYLVDVKGITSPHANLIKTLLIHGAEDIGYGYPSFDQGWGRVNVRNSVCPPAPNVLQWYHHSTGISSGSWDSRTNGGMQTWVVDDTVPLKITMAHWDTVGSGALTSDLDLVVTSPSGVRYEGNAFHEAWSTPCSGASQWGGTFTEYPSWVGGGSYDFDTTGDGGDDINNVELFRVKYPEKGQWSVQVVWKSYSALPFTVAMTGGFNASADANAATNAYKVSMTMDTTRIVLERDDFGEGIFKCAPNGSVIVPYWLNNGGTSNDAYAMTAPILPTGFTVAHYPASPISVNANARVHGYARIMVGMAVTAGTYTLSMKATSNNDATSPIAQSQIKFQIDVVTTKTPPTVKVAASPVHEDAPSFVSWTATNNYIACAYKQESQFGERVYFKLSSDGGSTWSTPIAISQPSWKPGFVTIERITSGTYAGRIAIAYTAWNPAGVAGDITDTRCGYVKVHYSTQLAPPYTTFTESNAWWQGAGVSVGNAYRTINLNWYPNGAQLYMVVECYGYTDTFSYTMNALAIIGKASMDGGVTWGAQVRVDPNAAGVYYFFPSVETDYLGNLACYYYERTSADVAQLRDLTYQYYTGTWSTMRTAWGPGNNCMFPQTVVSTQGVNSNRVYGVCLNGANTDGDRSLFVSWTDNANGNPPTFATGYGPYGPVLSDHDYAKRFVLDVEWSNAYLYIFAHRNTKYDPYGTPNMFVVYDNDFTISPVPTVEYLTADSFVHGKQRATSTTNGGLAKVFVAQNTYTKDGNMDIIGMHVFNGWQSAADTLGPVTEYVSADKTICNAGDLVTIVANVHDLTTGGNNIAAAEYKTDVSNVTGVAMQTLDGSFNSPAEAVASSTEPISTAGWTVGWHWIYVRGQDSAGNWGGWTGMLIYVNPQIFATASVTGPTGTSNVASVTITYTWAGTPTSVNLYYTTDTAPPYTWTLMGNEATVDGARSYVITGGSATYGWKASAVGGGSSELSPPSSSDPPEATYIYDIVPPAAPSGLSVEHYGPGIPLYHNTLNWTHNGTDVAQYKIYRSTRSTGPWNATNLVGTVPLGTNSYCDANKGQADSTRWWYVVRAQDAAGNQETNANSVQEPYGIPTWFNRTVVLGWNLVAVPLVPINSSLPAVLDDQAGGAQWTRAMSYVDGKWLQYNKAWPPYMNTLKSLNEKMGFWVYVTALGDGTLTWCGDVQGLTSMTFKAGWNLVGFPNWGTPFTIAQLKSSCPGIMIVEGFSQIAEYRTTALPDSHVIARGNGYWVYAVTDCTFSITNPVQPVMSITNTAPATANPGETVMYTISCSNVGASMACNVWVNETYPAGVTFLNANPLPTIMADSWFFGNVAPGASLVIFINVTLNSWTEGVLTNYVWLDCADATGLPMPPAGASAATVVTSPAIDVTKNGPAMANNGQSITYTISIWNHGTGPAYNVVVTDTYPSGVTFVSAMPAPTFGDNTWAIGSIPPGSTLTIYITVIVDMNAVGALANRVDVGCENGAGIPLPGEWAVWTTLVVGPYMALSKLAPSSANAGEMLTYTLAYSNNGTDWAYNVTVADILPPGVAFVSAVPAPTVGIDTWFIGAMAPGAMGNITIIVVVDSGASGTLLNSAYLDCQNAIGIAQPRAYANASTAINGDTVPPLHSNERPMMDGFARNANPAMSVHVTDYGSGVNASTIRFYIDGFSVFYDAIVIAGGYNVSYIHGSPYADGQTISCRIVARDYSGNLLDFTWSYIVDVSAPSHGGESPAPGGASANTTPVISVTVTDIFSGVNASTIRLYIQGYSVMYDLQAVADGYAVSYWHEGGFAHGATVSCRIVARDYAGNLLDYTWTFTVP